MAVKNVTILIKQDGEVVIEANGFVGSECEKIKPICEALGVIKAVAKKPEYFQAQNNKTKIVQ
jgi:hypothetical protein